MVQPGGNDREELGFVPETRTAFAAIAAAHDLVEIGSDAYSVAYHGPLGWLTVFHDRLSYELDVALALNAAPETGRPYGIADLIRVVDPAAADWYRCFSATTASGIRSGLDRLAHDLRVYGEAALSGEPAFLAQLEGCRQRAIDQFARDRSRARHAAEAAKAIRRKDWNAVVALYGPVEDQLDRVAAKRLEIARKRLAGR
jgi:hypothetical protein